MDDEKYEELKKRADCTSSESLGSFMEKALDRMHKDNSDSVVFTVLNKAGRRMTFCMHIVEIDGKHITDFLKTNVVKDNGQVH